MSLESWLRFPVGRSHVDQGHSCEGSVGSPGSVQAGVHRERGQQNTVPLGILIHIGEGAGMPVAYGVETWFAILSNTQMTQKLELEDIIILISTAAQS